jgi:mannitol-specific phosphotransferase system IIBC component
MLYATSYVGWRIFDFSRSFEVRIAGGFETFEVLSSLPFTILGVALLLGGFVGIVHNVLVDLLPRGE